MALEIGQGGADPDSETCADCGREAIDALGGVWLCDRHYRIREGLALAAPLAHPQAPHSPYAALYGDPGRPLPELFVGGNGTRIGEDALTLHGARCFTAVHSPRGGAGTLLSRDVWDARYLRVLLDSGAFSDPPSRRLSFEDALDRQLGWERSARRKWDAPGWFASAIVAYDVLIDEKWSGAAAGPADRRKERWDVGAAEWAISETAKAAEYLARERPRLRSRTAPRTIVLPIQGVTAEQYARCAGRVLAVAEPGDWAGLGGWCILGRYSRQWLPTFWAAMAETIPQIAAAGLGHAHIFGCLYLPALAGLLWLCDAYGLTLSTDSARPLMDVTRAASDARHGRNKSGARGETWPESVAWWADATMRLRRHPEYRSHGPTATPGATGGPMG